ncbi:MAG: glycosyltransferase family 2 protein [Saprospiraceae bacterium]
MEQPHKAFRPTATIALVIPCYNVATHIAQVIEGLPAFISWIIAVEDCSNDDTAAVLERLQMSNPRLICLRHEVNQGVGGAMLSGYEKALELGAAVVVKIDGDGQMDPGNIELLVKPLLKGKADFAKGNRFRDFRALRAMPIGRRIGNLGLSFIIKAASGYWHIFDPTNGFTAIKNETLAALDFSKIHKRYYFETSMLQELYFVNAVVQDVPMKARYGEEISGLSTVKTLFEFPPKLLLAVVRRILLKYYLIDFNVASLYLLVGLPLFLVGLAHGLANYFRYLSLHVGAPTGTVVIPTLMIILGFQLLLAAVSFDVNNYPQKNNGVE